MFNDLMKFFTGNRVQNTFIGSGPLLKRRSAPRPGSATHGYIGGFADWTDFSGPGFGRLGSSCLARDPTTNSFVHDWRARER